jgi:predicted ester cyclase
VSPQEQALRFLVAVAAACAEGFTDPATSARATVTMGWLATDAMTSLWEEPAMSSKKAVLLRIAEAMSAGNIDHVPDWFTEGFKLHDPSFGGFRSGHEGARDMLRSLAGHVPGARVNALDMVEEGDKVAVRWLFSGKKDGCPVYLSAVAIYRFEGERIAEDWGIAAKADWPMATSPGQ